MKQTKIINLFGGPGAGKSTISSGLFYELKRLNISCDNPYEFPKQVAWEDNPSQINDQLYIFANQHRGIVRSYGKVDYIILDSPILLSLAYKNGYSNEYPVSLYGDKFDEMVIEVFKKYDNINLFLNRPEDFQDEGRFQNYEESIMFDNKIKSIMDTNGIDYRTINVNEHTIDFILKFVLDL
jgi:hypothetical protein